MEEGCVGDEEGDRSCIMKCWANLENSSWLKPEGLSFHSIWSTLMLHMHAHVCTHACMHAHTIKHTHTQNPPINTLVWCGLVYVVFGIQETVDSTLLVDAYIPIVALGGSMLILGPDLFTYSICFLCYAIWVYTQPKKNRHTIQYHAIFPIQNTSSEWLTDKNAFAFLTVILTTMASSFGKISKEKNKQNKNK